MLQIWRSAASLKPTSSTNLCVRPCLPRHTSAHHRLPVAQASNQDAIDIRKLADLISAQPIEDEEKYNIENIAKVLGEPLGTVKNMVFKKRGLLSMQPEDIKQRIETIARIVDVPYEKARRMAVIQPGLLFDTEKQAQVLQYGIKAICYELNAPREEIIDLIIENQSVLHGRELHLSVADIAHLAILREPKGRIVD